MGRFGFPACYEVLVDEAVGRRFRRRDTCTTDEERGPSRDVASIQMVFIAPRRLANNFSVRKMDAA